MKISALFPCAFAVLLLACLTPPTLGIELDDPIVDPILDAPVQEIFDDDSARGSTEDFADGCCDCSEFWKYRRKLADKHAPAGLMGDHVHHQGDMMVEYKFMHMDMRGNRIGTRRVTAAEALAYGQGLAPPTNVAATPTAMTMDMHMLHFMYGLTDDITLLVMPMWSSFRMDHLRNDPFPPNAALNGLPFTTETNGFDDLVLGALWRVHKTDCEDLILNLSLSVPTGDIDETTTAANPPNPQEFPYPMRHGSGTVDLRPAITYKKYLCCSSYGAQASAILPLGRNWDDYSEGAEYRASGWYSQLVNDNFALSFRVENVWRENFDGIDSDFVGVVPFPPAVISTNRGDMRGGYWLNLGYGAALLHNGHLLNLEVVRPVYQDVEGVQLEQDWTLFASWSKGF